MTSKTQPVLIGDLIFKHDGDIDAAIHELEFSNAIDCASRVIEAHPSTPGLSSNSRRMSDIERMANAIREYSKGGPDAVLRACYEACRQYESATVAEDLTCPICKEPFLGGMKETLDHLSDHVSDKGGSSDEEP